MSTVRPPDRLAGRGRHVRPWRLASLAVLAAAAATPLASSQDAASTTAIPAALADFQRDVSPAILDVRPCDAKHWRQIEPAVQHLALQHADRLARLDPADRAATLAKMADLIDRVRGRVRDVPVLAPGRRVIGLLDPDRGLGPKEVTAIAEAYGGSPRVFKKDEAGETLDTVADSFLAAIREAAAGTSPATVVVLGHGLPTEIQSYHIRYERVADALVEGAVRRGTGGLVDLGDFVLVCDDCYSADFTVNLLDCIDARCRDRRLPLRSLPVCLAGTNRDRYGLADFGEKFVPHFWKDVIELYYIRRPRPAAVVLRHFFENVDNMMYGYGRRPVMQGTAVTGWTLVDPALVQDPVVFVPLEREEAADLRAILGLGADDPLPGWLDIG